MFGNKSDKDVVKLKPMVDTINGYFDSYSTLTDDQLRDKTDDLRLRIAEHLKGIDDQLTALNKQIDESESDDLSAKDAFFEEIDKLEKERNEELEKSA